LLALSCSTRDEEQDHGASVRIVLGDEANETLAHNVTNVESLHLESDEEGADEGLRIVSAQGMTMLRFRSPAA
jgi:hypothetical protein